MVKRIFHGLVVALVVLLASCSTQQDLTFVKYFAAYKALFIDDGRVLDTGNGDVSHSEGQGYAMLFAVGANDKDTFDALWQWSQRVLQREDKLFSWRYRPCPTHDRACIDDINNASDGEILIAWALLRAADKWDDEDYASAATAIINKVESTLIKDTEQLTLLLPGEVGFEDDSSVQVNLSYWIFPALKDIAQHANQPEKWNQLYTSGLALLAKSQFSQYGLPSDWVRVENSIGNRIGNRVDNNHREEVRLSLDKVISAEYGFNAVRIPLHLAWSGPSTIEQHATLFEPFNAWWEQPKTPATVNLLTEKVADYEMTLGMRAVETAVSHLTQGTEVDWPEINRTTDYYSASLTLLSMLAVMDNPS